MTLAAAATLGLVVGGQIPAETELCDNAYPVCPGTGFVRRNNNLLDACVCPAEHVETADGQACRFDCENVHYREDAEGLASCGACLPGHVEDELGGAACLPQLNCADEHRMQINAHTCGPCLANQAPDKNGACLADMTCPQGRVQRTPYSCGGCAAGYAASETMVTVVAEGDRVKEWRTCLRTPCPSGFRDENGNCPETPQAAQCAAAAAGGASVRRWGAKLDDGGCLPVQTCLFGSAETLLRQAADAAAGAQVFGCHLWSDTDRPEAGFRAVTVIAGLTVKASVSYLRAAGECSGERIGNEFVVDNFANPTFYAPSCNAGLFDCPKGLKDPNNPFSLCNPDTDNPKYDQANCEGLGVNGEWEQITSDPAQDSRSRDSARVCKIGEDVCYVNANKGDDFNPDATAFYLYPEAANRGNDIPADGFLFADKVAGECRTQYPATCARGVLRVAGNPFSGCVFTEVRSPGVPRVSATASALATVGAASLSWAPSAVIGAATLWGYAVWREVDGAPFVSIGFTTGTVYADAAATPESEVRYRIRARVPEGELLDSDPSDVVRIPGCRRTGHAAVERPGSLPPLCVPESAKSAAQKCADAGWDVIYSYDSPVARCGVSVRDAPSGHVENCGLWGDFHLACEDAFGAGDDLNFPTNHGYRREFVFNCGMGGTGRVPDPEYDLYADYGPRQECVCQAGSFESPTTGQCASCSVLHRLPLPGVTGRCGECAQEMREDGTCYVEWTMRTTPIPPNRGAVAVSGLNGTLLAAPSASHGTFVTIAARPAARHYLSGWAGDPRCAAVGNPENPGAEKLCIVRMTANVDLTAYFTAQLLQTVTYAQIPAGQIEGTLTASVPSGGTTLRGATVTFTAAPAADRYVSGWAGDQRCADIGDLQNTGAEKTCAVRVTANVNLTAYFNAAWTIAFSGADVSARRTIADGGATVVSGDRAPGGATIVFSVTPTLGYVARWTNRGAAVCNGQNPCLLTADAHLDVTAAYAPQPQTVVYSATPDGQVGGTLTASVPSGGTTLRGFAVTFIASPAAGWRVGRWDGDAENCALSSLPCALTANADLSVRVHFYDDERSANNAALIAEVAKPPGAANPATVVALLNLPGGDPNAKDAADRPLLIVAARNGHARIVSILVTAGADPTATDPSFYNWNVPQHAAAYLPAAAAGPRALRASVLYHFDDALNVVGGGGSAGFDWNRQDGGRALDLLAQAEDRRPAPAGENAGIIYQMADYIRARGGECDSAAEKTRRRICIAACPFGQNFIDGFCFCPGGQGPNPENGACGFCPPGEWTRMDGGCGACPAGQEENGGFCACPAGQAVLSRDNPVCYPQAIADAYAKCAGSGHIPSVAGSPANPSFTCAVYNRHADFNAASSGSAANQNACAFPDSVRQSDPDARLCSEVFGPQFAFPQKPPTGQERYVFNCGASQARRLPSVPAAINTVGATECACPAGEELVEGICVPHAVADVADDCAAHGWDVSVDPADNTLLCAPFFRLYNDAAGAPDDEDYEDGCAIEASAATPSCAQVFGDPPQFPTAAGADDRTYFVANCSRGGSIPGAIPASVNTVAAAACSCNSGDGYVGNWPACACPAEQGTLADGNCGVCPDGRGILPDKSCGLCPAERGILANAACGSCSAGEKIRADGTCGACPTGQTGASDFYCGVCAGGQEVINGACACPAGESPVDFTDGETLCYPQAVADAADKCRQSGHIPSYGLPSEVSLHACAVSTRNADSQDGDKAACLLSDDAADSPRCSEVFGADLVFPQRPAVSTTLAYVYNCDPNGATGMIPATVNTIGAVQCVCPAGQGLVDGSCRACPSEQGILANGSCGACPSGQGALADGTCGACVGGTALINGVCACPASTGQELINGVCACPSGQGALADGTCGACVGGTAPINGVCACPVSTGQELINGVCACPSGQGALADGTCGVCPPGQVIGDDGACAPACPIGQAIDDDGSCAACPSGQGVFPDGKCRACPTNSVDLAVLTTDGVCTCSEGEDFIDFDGDFQAVSCFPQNIADAYAKCKSADYSPSAGGRNQPTRNTCTVLSRDAGRSVDYPSCFLDDAAAAVSPHCTDVFGPGLAIPPKPTNVSAPRYVFNCDPAATSGLLPATVNTVAATECVCPAGQSVQNGVCADIVCPDGQTGVFAGDSSHHCVPNADAAVAAACAAAGWGNVQTIDISGQTHLYCPVRSARYYELTTGVFQLQSTVGQDGASLGCGVTGDSFKPTCVEMFGNPPQFPQSDGDDDQRQFLANCSRDGGVPGGVPAGVNLVEATECACADGGNYPDCACPFGQGILDDNTCGVCPPGQGVRAGGNKCDICPFGQGVLADGNCGVCPNGLGVRDSTNTCGVCPSGQVPQAGVCNVCSGGQTPQGGVCACPAGWTFVKDLRQCLPDAVLETADKCSDSGHSRISHGAWDAPDVSCLIKSQNGQNAVDLEECRFPDAVKSRNPNVRLCSEVFGPDLNFPAPTLNAGGAPLSFVFNCDPDGTNGMIPAAINTISATECACPAGERAVEFASGEILCYPQMVADAADKCRRSGHVPSYGLPSGTNLHACVVSTRNADSQDGDQPTCLLSDSAADSPRCSEIFGPDLAFPQKPAAKTTLTYVYNCDPNNRTGIVPATANTIGATECACPAGQGMLDIGICGVCPTGQGLRSDNTCVVCPSGQGVLADGTCNACPSGQGVLPDGTCGACPSGQGVFANGNCGECTTGEGVLANGNCGVCIGESTSINGVCTCPAPAGQEIINGACACPDGQGVLDNNTCGVCPPNREIRADGTCGACPEGQGILNNGSCGVCIGGASPINGVCTCPAPAGQEVINGACACPDGQGIRDDNSCGSCVTGEVIDGNGYCNACPNGQGIFPDGKCYVCPDGASLEDDGACVCPAGTLASRGACDSLACSGDSKRVQISGYSFPWCVSNAAANIAKACEAAGWGQIRSVNISGRANLYCPVRSARYALTAGVFQLESTDGQDGVPLVGCGVTGGSSYGDSFKPTCVEMFGDPPQFPQSDSDDDQRQFWANCSRDGTLPGGIPAGINRVEAAECACANGGDYPNCACPSGQGLLDNNTCAVCSPGQGVRSDNHRCGVCPSGEGILSDGTCGACPEGRGILDAVNACGVCPSGEGILSDGTCGVCPEGRGILDNTNACGVCPSGEGILSDGTCDACPSGEGILSDGRPEGRGILDNTNACGVCPSGEGILSDGTCDACPSGEGILSDGTCAVCPSGEGILSDGTCDACPSGEGILSDGTCGACPARFGQILRDGVCACPPGEGAVDAGSGQFSCYPQQVADRHNKCVDRGYDASIVGDDNSCAVPNWDVRGGSGRHDACLLNDDASGVPLCAQIFGSDFAVPQKPADGSNPRYVFNCDSYKNNGSIPATINTIGATACACPDGWGIHDGVCVAVCPDGRGLIVADGSCGDCPAGETVQDGVCTLDCPNGQRAVFASAGGKQRCVSNANADNRRRLRCGGMGGCGRRCCGVRKH